MLIHYKKPALTLEQQVDQLERRGLTIHNRATALNALGWISYYRLSAYWHPYKNPDDSFVQGASFERAVALYDFDRRLRLLALDGVERVEVRLRTLMTDVVSQVLGPLGYCDSANFREGFDHSTWFAEVEKEINRSKERFVDHFKSKYSGFPQVPIWMGSELMSLGAISQMFKGLRTSEQDQIARAFNVHRRVAESWFHTLTVIRNVCAHHGRLWNRQHSIPPKLPKEVIWRPVHPKRVYAILCILRHATQGEPAGDWAGRARAFLTEADQECKGGMGVPHDWASSPFWV